MKRLIRPAARQDILRQYRYYLVEQNAPATSARFLKAVKQAISQVCRAPKIGQIKLLDNPKLVGLRSWPVRGFAAIRIYYLLGPTEIRVIRVLHSKRDVVSIMKQESGGDEP